MVCFAGRLGKMHEWCSLVHATTGRIIGTAGRSRQTGRTALESNRVRRGVAGSAGRGSAGSKTGDDEGEDEGANEGGFHDETPWVANPSEIVRNQSL